MLRTSISAFHGQDKPSPLLGENSGMTTDRAQLEAIWEPVRNHLKRASAMLEIPAITGDDDNPETQVNLKQFHSYFQDYEMELALDELEDLGEMLNAPVDFWFELASAARTIGLHSRLPFYDSQIRRYF